MRPRRPGAAPHRPLPEPSAARERRPDFADDYPAPQIRPPQPLGEHPGAPCFLFRQEIWAVGHSVGRTLPPVFPRRRAMAEPPLCCAVARARPRCSLAVSSRCFQCQKPEPNGAGTALTRYTGEPKPPVTAGRPLRPMQPLPKPTSGSRAPCRSSPTQSPLKSQLGGPSSVRSGNAPPRERVSGGQRRRFPATSALSRPIKNGRARLDRIPIRSEPLDIDPTTHTRRYRFGLANLL